MQKTIKTGEKVLLLAEPSPPVADKMPDDPESNQKAEQEEEQIEPLPPLMDEMDQNGKVVNGSGNVPRNGELRKQAEKSAEEENEE